MNVAISGSRTFTDQHFVETVVARLLARHDFIILGDAPAGVDLFAWAYLRNIHWANWTREVADWERLGKRAGHERNGRMIARADLLVAIFAPGPLTRGTDDAVEQALEKGIPVHIFHEGMWHGESSTRTEEIKAHP